ncbi:MAG TPA: hypothetical protein VN366_07955 [Feifaniaceae bacterium]|nr:hypothetical protein [Feifaniaceae bacterium]
MTNAGIKAVLRKAMIENEETSTAWMGFYLNVYLYLALVFSAVAVPNALYDLYRIPIWAGAGNILELVLFFVKALWGIAAIGTFIELRDFTQRGYKWNAFYLCSSFVGMSLAMLSAWLEGEPGARMTVTLERAVMILALGWLIPNLRYFKKRKHLFRPYTTAEVAAALKGEPPAPALPIRKPCHDKPTKAKVDVRKFYSVQANGKTTRFVRVIRRHGLIRGR